MSKIGHPNLKQDIKHIIENSLSVNPRFKSDKQYVKMSISKIKKYLIKTGNYNYNSFSDSYLNNLLNALEYDLKKVQKKALKKIDEIDDIFEKLKTKKKKQ